jgi:hypothetical protein
MTLTAKQRHTRMVVAKIKATPEWADYQAAEKRWRDSHLVYVIQYGTAGLIKIGYTSDVARRVKSLQWQAPMPLRVLGWGPGGHTEEQRLHRLFKSSRAYGEWFTPTSELLEYTATRLGHGPHPVPVLKPHTTAEWHRRQAMTKAMWALYGRYPIDSPSPGAQDHR